MPTIKTLYEELILQAARDRGKLITVEEHNISGGQGEAVCSLLAEHQPVPVKRLGIPDEFDHSGSADELLQLFGLNAEHIAAAAKEMLGK